MLPAVLHFIFARGLANMWSKIMVVRHRDKQTSEQLLKKAIMRRLNELLLYGTYCMVLTVRYCTVLYGTARYCISLSHHLYPLPSPPPSPPSSPPPLRPHSCIGIAVGEGQRGRTLRWRCTAKEDAVVTTQLVPPAGSIAKPCKGSSRATCFKWRKGI